MAVTRSMNGISKPTNPTAKSAPTTRAKKAPEKPKTKNTKKTIAKKPAAKGKKTAPKAKRAPPAKGNAKKKTTTAKKPVPKKAKTTAAVNVQPSSTQPHPQRSSRITRANLGRSQPAPVMAPPVAASPLNLLASFAPAASAAVNTLAAARQRYPYSRSLKAVGYWVESVQSETTPAIDQNLPGGTSSSNAQAPPPSSPPVTLPLKFRRSSQSSLPGTPLSFLTSSESSSSTEPWVNRKSKRANPQQPPAPSNTVGHYSTRPAHATFMANPSTQHPPAPSNTVGHYATHPAVTTSFHQALGNMPDQYLNYSARSTFVADSRVSPLTGRQVNSHSQSDSQSDSSSDSPSPPETLGLESDESLSTIFGTSVVTPVRAESLPTSFFQASPEQVNNVPKSQSVPTNSFRYH